MNRTRLSLLYLGSYLFIIGIGLLFARRETLKILQSNGDYGRVRYIKAGQGPNLAQPDAAAKSP